MTISSTNRVAGPFTGDGTAAIFPFTFKVFDETDLYVVTLDLLAGTISVLALTTDYTASLNADQDTSPGGSITLVAGNLASGLTLTITTDMAALQGVDLTNGGGFYPDVINGALDTLTILIQQLQDQVNRSIQIPLADGALNTELPPASQRAGKFLYFGNDGSPTLVAIGPPGVTLFAGQMLETPDGVKKVFTLTNAGVALGKSPLQLIVWRNFPLILNVGYTLGPGADQVTFTDAPLATDNLFAQGSF